MQEGHKFWREFFIQLEIWIQEFEVVSWICTQLGGSEKGGWPTSQFTVTKFAYLMQAREQHCKRENIDTHKTFQNWTEKTSHLKSYVLQLWDWIINELIVLALLTHFLACVCRKSFSKHFLHGCHRQQYPIQTLSLLAQMSYLWLYKRLQLTSLNYITQFKVRNYLCNT